jgi:hypothetical protein
MKTKLTIYLIIFGLFIQCNKEYSKKLKPQKIEKISAINNYNLFGGNTSLKFQFFSDSSYVFTFIDKDLNHDKVEKFNDFCYSKNDTIYFSQTRFRYNGSEKAVIKNNFIEFIDGDFPLKIEIKKNLLQTKNRLNLEKYNDYTFFTFEAKFHKKYFNDKTNILKPTDLDQNELIEMDQILQRCFKENASKLKNINLYIKQCIVVINQKQEKEVWISCYCKDFSNKDTYKYALIMMDDGGNCNINLKINLTKHNYSQLNIAGRA